jgi:hypothetical protein
MQIVLQKNSNRAVFHCSPDGTENSQEKGTCALRLASAIISRCRNETIKLHRPRTPKNWRRHATVRQHAYRYFSRCLDNVQFNAHHFHVGTFNKKRTLRP